VVKKFKIPATVILTINTDKPSLDNRDVAIAALMVENELNEVGAVSMRLATYASIALPRVHMGWPPLSRIEDFIEEGEADADNFTNNTGS